MNKFKVYYDLYNEVELLGKYENRKVAMEELTKAAKRIKYETGLKKITFYVYKDRKLNLKIEL